MRFKKRDQVPLLFLEVPKRSGNTKRSIRNKLHTENRWGLSGLGKIERVTALRARDKKWIMDVKLAS